jgi:hypothetical protein
MGKRNNPPLILKARLPTNFLLSSLSVFEKLGMGRHRHREDLVMDSGLVMKLLNAYMYLHMIIICTL